MVSAGAVTTDARRPGRGQPLLADELGEELGRQSREARECNDAVSAAAVVRRPGGASGRPDALRTALWRPQSRISSAATPSRTARRNWFCRACCCGSGSGRDAGSGQTRIAVGCTRTDATADTAGMADQPQATDRRRPQCPWAKPEQRRTLQPLASASAAKAQAGGGGAPVPGRTAAAYTPVRILPFPCFP